MNTCQNCKYWDGSVMMNMSGDLCGRCRKNAPITDTIKEATRSTWPWTSGDDWCGQHNLKEFFTAPKYTTQQEINALMIDLVRKHGVASNAMTEQQIADALRQAIACGDFIRHVQSTNNAQCVIYMPFARESELLSEIDRLKKFIEANGMKIPTSVCDNETY